MDKTGKNIKQLRLKNHLTVRQLQTILGFDNPQSIYKWQAGSTLPSIDNLIILADVFHVKMDDIIAKEK